MIKFNRNYKLTIQLKGSDRTLVIGRPFTIEFDVNRNTMSSQMTASFTIYNLAPEKREYIRKDVLDYSDIRRVILEAGYGNNLSLVFSGNIAYARSFRDGSNFLTQIVSYSAGFAWANAETSRTVSSGTPNRNILQTLIGDLPGVGVGAIGNFPGSASRDLSLSGRTVDVIRDLTGGNFFIDNDRIYILNEEECVRGDLKEISEISGLLNTPIQEESYILLDMLFEPQILMAQQISLESKTARHLNGLYKVVGIRHRATISESVCGDAVTSLALLSPPNLRFVS